MHRCRPGSSPVVALLPPAHYSRPGPRRVPRGNSIPNPPTGTQPRTLYSKSGAVIPVRGEPLVPCSFEATIPPLAWQVSRSCWSSDSASGVDVCPHACPEGVCSPLRRDGSRRQAARLSSKRPCRVSLVRVATVPPCFFSAPVELDRSACPYTVPDRATIRLFLLASTGPRPSAPASFPACLSLQVEAFLPCIGCTGPISLRESRGNCLLALSPFKRHLASPRHAVALGSSALLAALVSAFPRPFSPAEASPPMLGCSAFPSPTSG